MALDPLAAATDVEDRLFNRSFTPDESWKVTNLLQDASAKIRRYTGQQFTRVENDVAILRVYRMALTLPQFPADKPTLVRYADGWPGVVVVPNTGWWWNGIDSLDFSPPQWIGNGPALNTIRRPTTVEVTYSHGYTEIPDDVVAIVCAMVGRVAAFPGVMPGLRQGALDDFSFTLGGNITTGAIALLPDEMAQLDRYRRRHRSAVLR